MSRRVRWDILKRVEDLHKGKCRKCLKFGSLALCQRTLSAPYQEEKPAIYVLHEDPDFFSPEVPKEWRDQVFGLVYDLEGKVGFEIRTKDLMAAHKALLDYAGPDAKPPADLQFTQVGGQS